MAYLSIRDIKVSGISACVPKEVELNAENPLLFSGSDEFVKTTGVEERRISSASVCTSDLCLKAAELLIKKLNWDKNEIDILVVVTQTPDYIFPVTSTILQNKLGLSTECIAYDIPLGCSGYIYGLSSIASMMSSAGLRKGILLAGDTISKIVSKMDKSTQPLFGDAGTATALEFESEAAPLLFHLGSDGNGYPAIMIPHGGSRSPVTKESFEIKEFDGGISRNQCNLVLDGMDVFSFGITQAPKTVNQLFDHFKIDKERIHYFVFHQANLMMNKMIAKKLKLPSDKVPTSLKKFGNTSSASIPLTIVTELKDKANSLTEWVLCGFGVGLSWGTLYIKTNNLVCPELIEYE